MPQENRLVDAMGRPLNHLPTYISHPSGIARIYWRGQFRNLPGAYGSIESQAAFHRLSAVIAAIGRFPDEEPAKTTVAELGERFIAHARQRYRYSRESINLSYAVDAMTELFGDRPAESFGPPELKAVRYRLLQRGQCRNTVNARAKQITAIFRWAVEERIVPHGVWATLSAVRPIARGQDGATDYDAVRPISDGHYMMTLDKIPSRYRPALEVQRLTGMRSGELLSMCPYQVIMTGRHWFYRPRSHKTMFTTGDKIIGIVKDAAVILTGCMPETWAHRWFAWSVDTHYHAVVRAAIRAGVPPWHPHQLRHGVATRLERLFGEHGREAARLILSHTDTRTTGRYVQPTAESLEPILDRLSQITPNNVQVESNGHQETESQS